MDELLSAAADEAMREWLEKRLREEELWDDALDQGGRKGGPLDQMEQLDDCSLGSLRGCRSKSKEQDEKK